MKWLQSPFLPRRKKGIKEGFILCCFLLICSKKKITYLTFFSRRSVLIRPRLRQWGGKGGVRKTLAHSFYWTHIEKSRGAGGRGQVAPTFFNWKTPKNWWGRGGRICSCLRHVQMKRITCSFRWFVIFADSLLYFWFIYLLPVSIIVAFGIQYNW